MSTKKMAAAAIVAALGVTTLAACGTEGVRDAAGKSGAPTPKTVTLVSHDSFNASKEVLAEFTKQTGFTVKVLKSGDAGEAVNKEILTKGSPQGDVFFGVDNTLLSRALDNGIFVPYEAKGLDRIPAEVQLDKEHRVTPIDSGDICVNYDKKYFADKKLNPRRPSTILRSPRTRTCWSWRTPSVPPRASASCSAPPPSTATRAGRTTGRSSRPTA